MNDYGKLAQRKFQDYVSKAISRNGTHAALSEADTRTIAFTVLETFHIYVTKSEARYADVASHGDNDHWVTKNTSAYEALVSDEIASLKSDPELFRTCQAKVENTAFLQHAPDGNVLQIYGNRRRIMHHFGCGRCAQTGVVDCPNNCNYQGKVDCHGCWGKGKTTCNICYGNGQVQRQSTNYINGVAHTHTYYESCGHCNYGSNPCYACFQTGKVTCGTCGGQRTIHCSPCAATGWLTDITSVSLEARYDLNRYVLQDAALEADLKNFIDKVGYAGVAEEATPEAVKFVGDHHAMTVQAQRTFHAPSSVYTASIGSESAQIRHFGNTATIIDAGGILDHVLAGSMTTFVEAIEGKGGATALPNVDDLAASLVQLLRTGLAREVVAAATPGNPDANAIHTALHRSSSVQSIETIMSAVRKALKKMRLPYLLKSTVAAWVLSPVMTFLLVVLGISNGWPGLGWGIGIAAASVAIGSMALNKRVSEIVPTADIANRDEYGEQAIASEGNPLIAFARSAQLLFTKVQVLAILGLASFLCYESATTAAVKHAEIRAKKRQEAIAIEQRSRSVPTK
jgi:hypothetical protein